MKAEQSADAASDLPSHWREVDWRAVTVEVHRLQVRIVKAVEVGRWGKVKALQRLLTTSRSGKLLAVRRVTENQGKQTPGVDGESWDTPEKKTAAVGTLHGRGYRPLPLRRIYIPKANGSGRAENCICDPGALTSSYLRIRFVSHVSTRFGSRLRQLRRERQLTQAQFADRVGMDRSYLSDVERGTKSMTLSYLKRVAEGFQLTVAELLDGID